MLQQGVGSATFSVAAGGVVEWWNAAELCSLAAVDGPRHTRTPPLQEAIASHMSLFKNSYKKTSAVELKCPCQAGGRQLWRAPGWDGRIGVMRSKVRTIP